ncbi:hypothetical protein [Flavobacterium urumqiense]|uniref:Uncharacterized protein n=1 Tax=Flavobacterium urumqiense TaxID=935224 RepID=A0A1H5SRD3_9FLAO|nr:hypothetical protein [Flavobacterium urumqiense]SEF52401.1 hypothetical protein SAMN04488130_101386 [Flavobacterium urumqiense]
MRTLIKKNKAVFTGLFFYNLIIAFLTPYILPERYFNDTVIIVFDKGHEIGWLGSYPFAIMFYKLTGLRHLPFFLIALIQFPIVTYILYKIGVPFNFHKLNVKNILVYIALLLLGIYMSMPTKEFITFLMFCTIPFIFQSNRKPLFKIIFSLFLIACFSFFRPYYLLMPILAVGMYLVSFIKFENKTFSTIFYGLLIAIFLSLSHGVIKGEYISKQTRENYVTNANKNSINTAIVSPISQDTWYGEAFGIVYGFMAVNVPVVEAIKHILSPQVLAFVIWQLLIFYILFVRFSRCLKNRKQYQFELWTLLILFAYFIVQGIFEPDLGTSIRHKIGLFPLIYFALYYEDFRKDIRQSI